MIKQKGNIGDAHFKANDVPTESQLRLPDAVNLSQEPLLRLQVAQLRASTLAASVNDDNLVCSGNFRGRLSAYDLSNLANPRQFDVNVDGVSIRGATFLPSGKLIVGNKDNTLFVLSRTNWGDFNSVIRIPVAVDSAPLGLGDDIFAASGPSGRVYILKVFESRCEIISSFDLTQKNVLLSRLGTSGLIATQPNGSLYVWRGGVIDGEPEVIPAPKLDQVAATGEMNESCFV